MRARAVLWICGVIAASAAVSAVALGDGQLGDGKGEARSTSTWGRAPAGTDAGASSGGDAGGPSPHRGLSTWGNVAAPTSPAGVGR